MPFAFLERADSVTVVDHNIIQINYIRQIAAAIERGRPDEIDDIIYNAQIYFVLSSPYS